MRRSIERNRSRLEEVPSGWAYSLFGLGVLLAVAGGIGAGAIEAIEAQALRPLRVFLDRGLSVPCRVVERRDSEPPALTVEYRLDFEDSARRAVLVGGAEPFSVSDTTQLLVDPLDPAEVMLAGDLDARVADAVRGTRPWRRPAWLGVIAGLLLSAITFLPMKRRARERGVPLVRFWDDETYTTYEPDEFWRYVGVVGFLGGALTVAVCVPFLLGTSRVTRLADHGVTVRGQVLESLAEGDRHRFRVRYALEGGAPPVESTTTVLGGIRAGRFEPEGDEPRDVELRVDPADPRFARFEPAMPWELERARQVRLAVSITLAFAVALVLGSAALRWHFRRSRFPA